jgi:hypothetical protein
MEESNETNIFEQKRSPGVNRAGVRRIVMKKHCSVSVAASLTVCSVYPVLVNIP